MWNADRRFKYIYSVSPGPGDYDIPLRDDENMKILKPRKGKVYAFVPIWIRQIMSFFSFLSQLFTLLPL